MTVFVVQDTKWADPKTGELKSKYDFAPALTFGELGYLLRPSASPFDLPPVISRLQERLADFSDGDYLLLTGSPVLLGLAVAIAADYNDGRVKMLQWNGVRKTYIPIDAQNIFAPAP